MKSFEVWLSVLITCFLIHVIHSSNKYQSESSREHRMDQKNRGSAEMIKPLPTNADKLQASASSPHIVNLLHYLNNSGVLNIDSIRESDGKSDVLTLAIPMDELNSLQDGVFRAQEISLEDLNKLTEDIQQFGIAFNGYNQDAIKHFGNPIRINLPDEKVDGNRQSIDKNTYQDMHFPRTKNEDNFQVNHHQGHHPDHVNQYPETYINSHSQNTAPNSDVSYTRGQQISVSKQPVKFRTEPLKNKWQGQKTFNSNNDDAKQFSTYDANPKENGQFSNTNQPKISNKQLGNSEEIRNHYPITKDMKLSQEYQPFLNTDKLIRNFQHEETNFRIHQPNHNDQNNFENYQSLSNRYKQSSVSYLPSTSVYTADFQPVVASQNRQQSDSAENQQSVNMHSKEYGGNAIIHRIGETGVDFPQNAQEETAQGNYKGDDGNGRFGSIPGIRGVDYPDYLSIPKTAFDCRQYNFPGYFADMEAQCQVYHICQADGRMNSFLCPVGTLFNQRVLVCDWWYNTGCASSESYFSRNAELYEESITASNSKGYHQSNLQHLNTRTDQNIRSAETFYNNMPERSNQNVNVLNVAPETRDKNLELVNGRTGRNLKYNDREDISMNFFREPETKYASEGNSKYPPSEHSGRFKIERMGGNSNPINDISAIRIENMELANERRSNNQDENSWENIRNRFSSKLTSNYAPERTSAISDNTYFHSGKKRILNSDGEQIVNLSFQEFRGKRPSGQNLNLFTQRSTSENLDESFIPLNENMFKIQENVEYNNDKYGVEVPKIENRADDVIQGETMFAKNKVINERLGHLKLPEIKPEEIVISFEETVQNREETNRQTLHESSYFGESEEMQENSEYNPEKFIHTESGADSSLEEVAFKKENILRHEETVAKNKESYENFEQEVEKGDETENVPYEYSFEANKDAKENRESINTINLSNLVSTRVAPNSRESVPTEDNIIHLTSTIPNSHIQEGDLKLEINQMSSDEEVTRREARGNTYMSVEGTVDERRAVQKEENMHRSLETFDSSGTGDVDSELGQNQFSSKESVFKNADIVDERNRDGLIKDAFKIKELHADEIRRKTASLDDGILTELASGDRLYRNILISEVISPRYRSTGKHLEQRNPFTTNADKKEIIENIRVPKIDDQFGISETPRVVKAEKYPINIDATDKYLSDTVDTAESRLYESAVRNPHEKTVTRENTYGKTFRGARLTQASNSTRMTRPRFKGARKKKIRLSRKNGHV